SQTGMSVPRETDISVCSESQTGMSASLSLPLPKAWMIVLMCPSPHLVAFGAEGFSHLAVEVDAVDELDEAFAVGCFLVGKDPDVGRDAGVVEHVGRQGDD